MHRTRAESHALCVFNFTQLLSAAAGSGVTAPPQLRRDFLLPHSHCFWCIQFFWFYYFRPAQCFPAEALGFFFSVLQGGQYGPVHLLLGHLFLSTGGCPFNFCLCFVQLSVSALGSVFLVYLGFIPLFPVWSTRIASRSATHLSFWIPFLNSVSIKLYICTHVGIAFVGTSKKTLLLKVIIFFSCSLIKLSRVQWPSFLLHAVLSYFFACVWNIDRNCEPVSKHFSVIRWWIQPAFPIGIAFEYLSKIGSPY